jgi:hypothetical protein
MKSGSYVLMLLVCVIIWPLSGVKAQTEQETRKSSAISTAQEREPTVSRRISSSSARDRRNKYGFNIGILGFYDSNMFGSTPKEGQWAVAPSPRAFLNFGSRKSLLHLDYRLFYRFYPSRRDLDSANHEGSVEYVHNISRRTTFSITDYVRSGPNDILSFTGEGLIPGTPDYQQVFFDTQHMFYNNLTSHLTFHPTRKHRLQVSGNYQTYRYRDDSQEDTDSIQARITDDYQFSKHWSLLGEAANEWIDSSENTRDGTIQRLKGGLAYQSGPNWRLEAKAGVERVDKEAEEKYEPSYEFGLTRETRLNRFDIRYNRESRFQIGLPDLNRYHRLSGYFDQRLNSWLSLHLLSRYYRTKTATYGNVDTLGGGAGFDFALHKSLVASIFGHYVYQHSNSPISIQDPNSDRYMVIAGLTYLFPSARRERDAPINWGR